MKCIVCLAVLLAPSTMNPLAHAGEQEIHACDFAVKARCVTGDARVTVIDGTVNRIEVNIFWCGLPHRPGYTCIIDSSRGDQDSQWSEDAGATVIANTALANADEPDRVKVTIGENVSIDLNEAQSLGRCGAGAELPQSIVIPARKGACRARLRNP
jgi:hypothetical protein